MPFNSSCRQKTGSLDSCLKPFGVLSFILFIMTVSARSFSHYSDPDQILTPTSRLGGRSYISFITFAADDNCTVFVNGNPVGQTFNWETVGKARIPLATGDVISMIASDKGLWYGAVMDVKFRRQHYATGQDGWKAVKKFEAREGVNEKAWMLPEYSGCLWPDVKILSNPQRMIAGKARGFPSRSKAKYVWASNAGESDTIFLRHMLGGENCSNVISKGVSEVMPKKAIDGKKNTVNIEIASPSGNSTNEAKGRIVDSSSDRYCICRERVVENLGTCWDMVNPGDVSGYCESRGCGPTFECAPGDPKASMICERKTLNKRVIRIDTGLCERINIPESEVYMFYATL